ncbi:uncharacterized protein CBL_14393 [Carabus blaptoides fortunei]
MSGSSPNKSSVTIVESLGSSDSMGSALSIKTTDNIECDVSSDGDRKSEIKVEKWWSITIQVAIPFIIAGFGTIGAGVVLGKVQHYRVFQEVDNLFILVPAILGLKGNLDMCLASRLSTQANLGNMSSSSNELSKMIIGNIAIVQVQAIVAAVLVSIFAVSMGAAMSGQFVFRDSILLTTSSVLTATVSCFILDFVMIGVIFASQKIKMNPDNIATPLAASIGDIVSLSLLSLIASAIYEIVDTYFWCLFVILGFYLCVLLPSWVCIVRRNKYTRHVLTSGWVPVISALIISGMGGLVLDSAVDKYDGFVVFQPIINGIGGNLVSVQSSRISTMLHQSTILGILPPHTKQWVAPWTALFSGVYSAKTARILILMAIPGQTIFVFIADYFFTWRITIDPDNSAIPYLTALGDFSGSGILLLAFMFLRYIGKEYYSNT